MLGIPVAISGTFIVMGESFLNYTLNELTTFGFILALGILVDDAIIVGENVFDSQHRLPNPIEATLEGVRHIVV